MKKKYIIAGLTGLMAQAAMAQGLENYEAKAPPTAEEVKSILANRKVESKKLSKTQDELSADVQELIEDQTNEKVIMLFEEVEELMANVTDNLHGADTGKDTIFRENKIIEKIFEAASERAR